MVNCTTGPSKPRRI
nr:unnamed protein product [Callosobruchus chinensis]